MKKKLRWWMVLILGLIICGGLGYGGYRMLIKPQTKRVADAETAIQAADAEIANKERYEAEKRKAAQEKQLASKDWVWFKTNKMPLIAGNPFWQNQRWGSAFKPTGVLATFGDSGVSSEITGEQALQMDYIYESREDLPTLLFDFFAATGCTLVSPTVPADALSVSGIGSTPGPVTFTGRFTVRGGFAQVLNLFRRLGSFPRLLAIRNVTITPQADTDGQMLTAGFDVSIYEMPDIAPESLQSVGPGAGSAAPAGGTGGGMMGSGMMGGGMMGSGMMGGSGGGSAPMAAPTSKGPGG